MVAKIKKSDSNSIFLRIFQFLQRLVLRRLPVAIINTLIQNGSIRMIGITIEIHSTNYARKMTHANRVNELFAQNISDLLMPFLIQTNFE